MHPVLFCVHFNDDDQPYQILPEPAPGEEYIPPAAVVAHVESLFGRSVTAEIRPMPEVKSVRVEFVRWPPDGSIEPPLGDSGIRVIQKRCAKCSRPAVVTYRVGPYLHTWDCPWPDCTGSGMYFGAADEIVTTDTGTGPLGR